MLKTWFSWYDKWTYLENAKTAKTWRILEWSKGVSSGFILMKMVLC